jgi:hypothetical protein
MTNYLKPMLILCALAGGMIIVGVQTNEAHAQARQMDCELVVEGETKIKSLCDFRPITGDGVGSFRITKTTGTEALFGQVIINRDDAKTGNALFGTITDGEEELVNSGVVKRNGPCWEGNGLKVCARSLTPPPAKATVPAKKAPPKKAMPR